MQVGDGGFYTFGEVQMKQCRHLPKRMLEMDNAMQEGPGSGSHNRDVYLSRCLKQSVT